MSFNSFLCCEGPTFWSCSGHDLPFLLLFIPSSETFSFQPEKIPLIFKSWIDFNKSRSYDYLICLKDNLWMKSVGQDFILYILACLSTNADKYF